MADESKVTIKVNDNGSLRVTGPVELVEAEGNPFDHKESFSLCRCGASTKPFCDGKHKSIGFESAPTAKSILSRAGDSLTDDTILSHYVRCIAVFCFNPGKTIATEAVCNAHMISSKYRAK